MINKIIQWFREHFWIFVLIFIMISGRMTILYSSNMNEHLLNHNYIFEFDLVSDSNNTHLHDFVFHYDFTENKGNISFHIYNKVVINSLRIKFPVAIDNTTLDQYRLKDGEPRDLKSPNKSTDVLLYELEEEYSDETLVIEFETDLEPNGWFRFHNEGSTLHYNKDFGNVHFVFGDKYECIQGCIHDPEGILEIPYSSLRDLRLNFTDEVSKSESSFKLSSIDRDKLFWKNFWLSIGVALFVSSLMIFLQEIKVYLQKRDDKDKFQEFSLGFLNVIKEKDRIGKETLNKIRDALSDYKKMTWRD